MKIQNSKFKILFICLAFLFTSVPAAAIAQDVTFVPSIELRGEYDDNVLYSRSNKTEDFLTRVKPAFTLDYATELLDLKSNVAVDIFRYKDETELDTESQDYGLDGKYRITERWSLSGDCSYVKDTTLESYLEQTGLLDPRQERKRYGAGGGVTYQISEVSDAGVDYSYNKTVYQYEFSTDYDQNSIALPYNHRLGNQLDMLTFQPYYSWYDSTVSKVDNYGLSLGWFHPFSETFSITTFVGARYTKTTYIQVDETNSGWGGTANIAIKNTGETYSTSLGYNRDLTYSSNGEPIDTDNIHFGVEKRLTERLRTNLSGGIYFTKSQGKYDDRDERYYSLSPSVSYNLTEYHSLILGYIFEQSLNKKLVTDQTADRNRVWLALQFKFPL